MISKHVSKLGRFPIILVVALLLWQMLPSQLQAQGRSDIIAQSEKTAPDGNGTFLFFDAPDMNESGMTAFLGFLSGTSGGDSDDSGIFLGNGGALTQIVRTGEAALDGNGTFSSFANPILNDSGSASFLGGLTGTSGGVFDNQAVFLGSAGTLAQIVRKGETAPDGNGTFLDFVGLPALNESGTIAFSGRLTGTSGGSTDVDGIFQSRSGSLTQIARSGDAAPDGNGTFSFFGSPDVNNSGTIVFHANNGVFRSEGSTLSQIARRGEAAPDGNGTYSTFRPPVLNESGSIAFHGRLLGTSGGNTDERGIFLSTGGSLTQIARSGEAAPDGNGTYRFFGSHVLNDSGTIAFTGVLTGTSGDNTDNSGIFLSSGGSLIQIVREGEVAPDGNGTFSDFVNLNLNDSGVTAFRGRLTGTSGGNTEEGIYLGDGIDLLQVTREGEVVSGSEVTFLSLASGARSGLNNNGQVAYQVRLADGSQMIRRFTPDLHWRSTFSSSWDSASRWTLGLRPDEVHDVFIDPNASLTVTGPSSDVAVNSLAIGGENSTGLAKLRLRNGSTITASNGVNVFSNGVLTGDGSIDGSVVSQGKIIADNLNFKNGGLTIVEGSLEGTGRVGGEIINKANGNIRANNGDVLRLTGPTLGNSGRIEVINGELEVSANVNNVAGLGLITGRDATMRFNGGVTNQGAIAITDGITDFFGDIDNTGAISVGGDAEAIFYDDITQNGTFEVSAFGSRTASAIVLGEFTGSGGFTGGGDLFLLGDLRPGNSPASVLMDGNLFLGATTRTEFEFAGDQLGEFDQLLVTGDLNLAGGLSVGILGGFELGFDQEFIVGDVGGDLFGQFAGFGEGDLVGNFGGRDLFISYSAGDGNDVSFFTAVPEPATGLVGLFALTGLFARRRRAKSAGVESETG